MNLTTKRLEEIGKGLPASANRAEFDTIIRMAKDADLFESFLQQIEAIISKPGGPTIGYANLPGKIAALVTKNLSADEAEARSTTGAILDNAALKKVEHLELFERAANRPFDNADARINVIPQGDVYQLQIGGQPVIPEVFVSYREAYRYGEGAVEIYNLREKIAQRPESTTLRSVDESISLALLKAGLLKVTKEWNGTINDSEAIAASPSVSIEARGASRPEAMAAFDAEWAKPVSEKKPWSMADLPEDIRKKYARYLSLFDGQPSEADYKEWVDTKATT